MALIEDMFKGNLATGLAGGIGAALAGPTVIRTIGSILRPVAKVLLENGAVFYRELWAKSGKWRPISSPKREPSWIRRLASACRRRQPPLALRAETAGREKPASAAFALLRGFDA